MKTTSTADFLTRETNIRSAIEALIQRLVNEDIGRSKPSKAFADVDQLVKESGLWADNFCDFILKPPLEWLYAPNYSRLIYHLLGLISLLYQYNKSLVRATEAAVPHSEMKELRRGMRDLKFMHHFCRAQLEELYRSASFKWIATTKPSPLQQRPQLKPTKNSKQRHDSRRRATNKSAHFAWLDTQQKLGRIEEQFSDVRNFPAVSCLDEILQGGQISMAAGQNSLQELFGVHRLRSEMKNLPVITDGRRRKYDYKAVLMLLERLVALEGVWPRQREMTAPILLGIYRYVIGFSAPGKPLVERLLGPASEEGVPNEFKRRVHSLLGKIDSEK